MPDLTWSDLNLDSAVLEVRFANTFLLWDRSGSLWSHVKGSLQDLESVQAAPNQTIFRLGRRWEMICELGQARVLDHEPDRPIEDLAKTAVPLVEGLRRFLEVSSYTRIGLRIIARREFESAAAASEFLLSRPIIQLPPRPLFASDAPPTMPEVCVTWNGKAHSVTSRLRVDERKAELNLPAGPEIEKLVTVKKTSVRSWGLTVDMDYFTTSVVLAAQWDPEEWARQAVHVVRRDALEWINTRRHS